HRDAAGRHGRVDDRARRRAGSDRRNPAVAGAGAPAGGRGGGGVGGGAGGVPRTAGGGGGLGGFVRPPARGGGAAAGLVRADAAGGGGAAGDSAPRRERGAAARPAASPAARTPVARPERSVAGTIRSVDGDALVIQGPRGREFRVTPAPGALIRLNGKSSKLD